MLLAVAFIVPFLSVTFEFSRKRYAFVFVVSLPTRFCLTSYVCVSKSIVRFLFEGISIPSPDASDKRVITSPLCAAAIAATSVG